MNDCRSKQGGPRVIVGRAIKKRDNRAYYTRRSNLRRHNTAGTHFLGMDRRIPSVSGIRKRKTGLQNVMDSWGSHSAILDALNKVLLKYTREKYFQGRVSEANANLQSLIDLVNQLSRTVDTALHQKDDSQGIRYESSKAHKRDLSLPSRRNLGTIQRVSRENIGRIWSVSRTYTPGISEKSSGR